MKTFENYHCLDPILEEILPSSVWAMTWTLGLFKSPQRILIPKLAILWLKNTSACSPTQPNWFQISGVGTRTLVFYIFSPEDSNVQLGQKTKSQRIKSLILLKRPFVALSILPNVKVAHNIEFNFGPYSIFSLHDKGLSHRPVLCHEYTCICV